MGGIYGSTHRKGVAAPGRSTYGLRHAALRCEPRLPLRLWRPLNFEVGHNEISDADFWSIGTVPSCRVCGQVLGQLSSKDPEGFLEVRVLGRERVVLDRVEGAAEHWVLGTLEHGPEREVGAVAGGKGDAVELGGRVQVGGHRLGERPRPTVLERGRVEFMQGSSGARARRTAAAAWRWTLPPSPRGSGRPRWRSPPSGARAMSQEISPARAVGCIVASSSSSSNVVEFERERHIWPETGEDLEQTGQQGRAGVDGAEVALAVVPATVAPPIGAGTLPARPGPRLRFEADPRYLLGRFEL